MKKNVLVCVRKLTGFFVLGLVIFGTGCATSGRAIITERDPIALVSVISNWDINWKGEDSLDPSSPGFLINRALRADPDSVFISNAEELIYTAEMLIRNIIEESHLINLAERELVLSSRAYQEAEENRHLLRRNIVKPGDHRFINSGNRDFLTALAEETGIQRSMFVEFNFTKAMVSGFGKSGTLRAELNMNVIIVDARGRTLYRRAFPSWSRDTIRVSSGVYNHIALLELFNTAIIDAVYDFLEHLER